MHQSKSIEKTFDAAAAAAAAADRARPGPADSDSRRSRCHVTRHGLTVTVDPPAGRWQPQTWVPGSAGSLLSLRK